MKKLMKQIDLFCMKHPNFGIPNLMLYIVIGNAIVWLFSLMDHSGMLYLFLTFNPALVLKGQIWRLVTFIFIPNSFSIWALIFFYFYYFIGNMLEKMWGTTRFNIFVLTGVLLTIVYGFIVYFITKQSITVDASFIYMSMFFSIATMFPDMQVLLFFIIPLKIKWLAYLNAAFFLISVFVNPFPVNLLPIIAMMNYLLFFGKDLIEPLLANRRGNSKQAVNFRREASKIKYEKSHMDYKHKCAVCGKTDAEYPNLEFRYCSRCAGYHCFCQEHINSHIHFTE